MGTSSPSDNDFYYSNSVPHNDLGVAFQVAHGDADYTYELALPFFLENFDQP